ncbi:MAG: polysialyltransferase family glycosyltransferase [Bacteroidota bacterium]
MNIVIITDPQRPDHYDYLIQDNTHNYYFLWYEKKDDSNIHLNPINSELIYWQDYSTPQNLITCIKPDRIVFFEIIDLRQIALIISAKAAEINTYFLDHGAANSKDTSISRYVETKFVQHKIPYLIKRFLGNFSNVLKAKYFYYSVITGFQSSKSYLKYITLPFLMLRAGPVEVLSTSLFKERLPEYPLIFNRVNLDRYNLYTGATEKDVILTGVPFFDSYFRNALVEEDYIVYIDHPYLEVGVAGWTADFHQKTANSLFEFAAKNKTKIYIKLHPLSDINIWKNYSFNSNYIEILKKGDYTELYLKSKLILGFSSSLITGFLCANKNVVLLGWNPVPGIIGTDFSATGLCHVSNSTNDLDNKYHFWIENNCTYKEPEYSSFIKNYNYPFDGKATERIINLIAGV